MKNIKDVKLFKKKDVIFMAMFYSIYILYRLNLYLSEAHIDVIFYKSFMIKYDIAFIIVTVLCIATINMFPECKGTPRHNDEKQKDKRVITVYIIYLIIYTILLYHTVKTDKISQISVVRNIKIFLLTVVLILLYFMDIKIKDFGCGVSKNSILLALFISVIRFGVRVAILGENFKFGQFRAIKFNFLNILENLILVYFSEELFYRGVPFFSLRAFELNDDTINMIQSIIFGLAHYNYFISMSYSNIRILNFLFMIMGTSSPIIIGYILGKLYMKTDSLIPPIIFHWVWNFVESFLVL